MKQELLNYYIQQDDQKSVMDVCRKYASQASGADPSVSGDLWIQALTYFRDLPSPACEQCLGEALDIISNDGDPSSKQGGGKNDSSKKDEIISPLLVLEIL